LSFAVIVAEFIMRSAVKDSCAVISIEKVVEMAKAMRGEKDEE